MIYKNDVLNISNVIKTSKQVLNNAKFNRIVDLIIINTLERYDEFDEGVVIYIPYNGEGFASYQNIDIEYMLSNIADVENRMHNYEKVFNDSKDFGTDIKLNFLYTEDGEMLYELQV